MVSRKVGLWERKDMGVGLTCVICGKKFIGASKSGKYCSSTCKQIGLKRVQAEWREKRKITLKPIKCKACGKKFTPINARSAYCSRSCYENEKRKRACERAKNRRNEIRKIKINKSNQQMITEIALEARKAGMSYGQYVAKYGE